ncbi:phage tail tape measure protein [Tepidanaerobacter syntrophicus]|uniref:phage tail tape measure protein n=1 Tax=Tepidanaerobacter syntrophicus TaxID=224999 RepID=UPI001BD64F24|nr:phage tail tape measure protein [Tepidanaerobacter syntrophicus]
MPGNIKGITIEIDGETKGLQKALSDVNKQSRDLQKELKGVESLLKLDPSNVELIAQKQKILAEQVDVTKEKLNRLKEAQAQVNEQYQKGDIGEEQYRDFQREIIATEQKLKAYETQLADVTQGHNKFKEAVEKAGESLKNIGSKMTDIGKQMSMKVTAPIAAVGTASIVAFKEVDGAMDTIITKTGATGKEAENLQNIFKNVSKTMPVDMQFVGDAVGELNTQFGLTGTELEKATEQMLKFAEINGTDVTTSTQNAKAAIEAYGLSTKDLSMVLDSVTKASQNTGLSVDQIYNAVIKGAPQIKAMGLDFSTAAEVMGRFEQKGIDSSKALTYLSKAQVTWAKDGKTMEQGLVELQKQLSGSKSETDKLALASELFGTKGASFMLDAIERGALDFDAFADSAKNASGTVSTTFEGTLDPIDKATVAMNNLKIVGADLATSLQEALAPVLDKIVDLLQRFSDWFNKLSPQTKETIVTIGLIVAALGPLLLIIGQIITTVSALMPLITGLGAVFAALTGPVGIAVAAIAGAIAIGVALYKNWDEIKTKAGEIWEKIKTNVMAPINALKGSLSGAWDSISKTASDAWEGLKNTASAMFNKVKDAILAPFKNLHIPLPHFKFSTKKMSIAGISFSVPDVDVNWYAKGGIFTAPQIIGIGEAGPEAVVPLDKLKNIITDALKGTGNYSGPLVTVENMTVRSEEDIQHISRELYRLLQTSSRQKGIILGSY